jgi:CopG family transcriptional regulator/antitoxin EndoAI
MRQTKVLSVSLPEEMLKAARRIASQENRTMSELVREALRSYQRERKAWQDIFACGDARAKRVGIRSEKDAVRIVREVRRKRR